MEVFKKTISIILDLRQKVASSVQVNLQNISEKSKTNEKEERLQEVML